jgi:hypothetical protein
VLALLLRPLLLLLLLSCRDTKQQQCPWWHLVAVGIQHVIV